MKDRMANRDEVGKNFTEYFYDGRDPKIVESKRDRSLVDRNSGIDREIKIMRGTRKGRLSSRLQRSGLFLC